MATLLQEIKQTELLLEDSSVANKNLLELEKLACVSMFYKSRNVHSQIKAVANKLLNELFSLTADDIDKFNLRLREKQIIKKLSNNITEYQYKYFALTPFIDYEKLMPKEVYDIAERVDRLRGAGILSGDRLYVGSIKLVNIKVDRSPIKDPILFYTDSEYTYYPLFVWDKEVELNSLL